MKQCNRCQLDFGDSVTVCNQCGDALIEVSQLVGGAVHCTQCGALAKPTWRFCKRCGAKMEDIEEALPAASGSSSSRALQGSASGLIEREGKAASASPPRQPWEPPRIEARNVPVERRCPRCHTALIGEAQYCDVCGAGARETTPKVLGGSTTPIVQGEQPRPAELVPVAAPGRVALTLGGYAEELQRPEAETLSPEERSKFKRVLIGALVLVALVILAVAVRLLWSRPSGTQRADQLTSAGTTPEKKTTLDKKETPKLFPAEFTVEAVEKEDQFAGGHAHVIVRLDDQALFIIRDEGEYASPVDRAKAVTENLRKAIANLQLDRASEFRVVNGPESPTIVEIMPNLKGEKELPIVSITHHDVSGYVRRSHRSLTAAELAEWWLNRLKDRAALFVKGEVPRLTATDEDGRLLADLYNRAEKESPGGRPTREALDQALRTLSQEQRRLLSFEGVRTFPNQKGHDEQK